MAANSTSARALGRIFDVGLGFVPTDLDASGVTGKRIRLRDYQGITFLVVCKAGTANDDLQIDINEHSASSGGTSQDLDIVTDYFHKTASSTNMDGTETWAKVTQSAASEISDVGGAGTSAEKEQILAIDIATEQLSDGFDYISLNVPDLGSAGAKYGACLGILWGLKVQRAPENMPATLS